MSQELTQEELMAYLVRLRERCKQRNTIDVFKLIFEDWIIEHETLINRILDLESDKALDGLAREQLNKRIAELEQQLAAKETL